MKYGAIILIATIALWPHPISAQGDYGVRIPSRDGQCLAPVASRLIGSNERDHTNRNSPTLAWDWSAAVGSPVFSICPGTVREASSSNRGGYGWFVVIDHGAGMSTLYAHCLPNSFRVKAGDRVDTWTQICSVGMTGMTSWPHVHLNIDKNGVHQNISNYFDPALTHYCHFSRCQATNKPGDPIRKDGVTAGQPQTTTTTAVDSKGLQILRTLNRLPAEQVSLLVWLALLGLLFTWWVSGVYVRVAIVATVTTTAIAGLIAVLFLPLTTPVQASQQPAPVGGDWEKAYQIVQGNEGWQCTNDGAYTMGGVTQGTYNRWRAKHGLGSADVCANLTREQAKAVFYELFWVGSGADRMPWALALTAVDHYYNTGKISHLLAQCGQDVACFNQARITDYKSKGNCSLYCQAWFNRVNKIRKYTGG